MYLQGPWAFGEIAKAAPDLELGMFPLPVTDDPDDLKARINMDLAAWIPEASDHKEAARAFLGYLFQPEVIQAYNESQLGFGRPRTPHPCTTSASSGCRSTIDAGEFYQGSTQLVPRAIPIMNYTAGHHARQRSAADPRATSTPTTRGSLSVSSDPGTKESLMTTTTATPTTTTSSRRARDDAGAGALAPPRRAHLLLVPGSRP